MFKEWIVFRTDDAEVVRHRNSVVKLERCAAPRLGDVSTLSLWGRCRIQGYFDRPSDLNSDWPHFYPSIS